MLRSKQTFLAAAVVAGLVLIAGNAVYAQGRPRGGPGRAGGAGEMPSVDQIFQQLDKNGDGKLTKDEMPERLGQFLMRADANGDGALTKQELAEARKNLSAAKPAAGAGAGLPTVDEMFQRHDKNADGKLTKDELPEFAAERLMRADANGDGELSKEELTEMRKKWAEQAGAAAGRDGPGGAGPGAGGRFDSAEMFQRLDRNGDGSLTKDELPERLAELLMRADADGNGSLSKEELHKAREHFRDRQGGAKQ